MLMFLSSGILWLSTTFLSLLGTSRQRPKRKISPVIGMTLCLTMQGPIFGTQYSESPSEINVLGWKTK